MRLLQLAHALTEEEGARVLGPLGRLVLEPAPERAEERLSRAGLRVIARQDRTMVAGRIP